MKINKTIIIISLFYLFLLFLFIFMAINNTFIHHINHLEIQIVSFDLLFPNQIIGIIIQAIF